MASPPRVGPFLSGQSCDWGGGSGYPQLDGPTDIDAGPGKGAVRFCVFFNPWGGITPRVVGPPHTASRWDKIYGQGIDPTQTGSFQVFAQFADTAGPVDGSGWESWNHTGNSVPGNISAAFLCFCVYGFDPKAVHWSFKPDMGRDGYYPGSNKDGTAYETTTPGVYVQNTCELVILLMAHLNLLNDGNIQSTNHGGPQEQGWNFQGIKRPHKFYGNYQTEPRQWGVVLSIWDKLFTDVREYTGPIIVRHDPRDTNYQIQTLVMSIRGKPTGLVST